MILKLRKCSTAREHTDLALLCHFPREKYNFSKFYRIWTLEIILSSQERRNSIPLNRSQINDNLSCLLGMNRVLVTLGFHTIKVPALGFWFLPSY